MWYANYSDELIRLTSKTRAEVTIWSDLDEQEAEVLARYWISRAKKRGADAQRVRGTIAFHEQYVVILAILVPRFFKTWRYYAKEGIGLPK